MTAIDVHSVLGLLGDLPLVHEFAPCRLEISGQKVSDPQLIESTLSGLGWTGWIARQSGVVMIADGVPPDDPSLGAIVSAELVAATTSVQVRRAHDGWWVTRITEKTGIPEDRSSDATRLRDIVKHVAHDGFLATYHRFWSVPDDGRAEVVAWRLPGFERA